MPHRRWLFSRTHRRWLKQSLMNCIASCGGRSLAHSPEISLRMCGRLSPARECPEYCPACTYSCGRPSYSISIGVCPPLPDGGGTRMQSGNNDGSMDVVMHTKAHEPTRIATTMVSVVSRVRSRTISPENKRFSAIRSSTGNMVTICRITQRMRE